MCVLLWVTSFVDSGLLETEDDAKRTYQNLLLVSVGCTAVTAPAIWITIDRVHLGK